MKLKLDENLPLSLKARLESVGHDVLSVADQGLLSQPDATVAGAAKEEGRLLLTLDRRLSDIRAYPPGTHPGIVVLRPTKQGLTAVADYVEGFVSGVDLNAIAGCVAVVEPGRIRIRRP